MGKGSEANSASSDDQGGVATKQWSEGKRGSDVSASIVRVKLELSSDAIIIMLELSSNM